MTNHGPTGGADGAQGGCCEQQQASGLKDPVCGMTVTADSEHRYNWQEHDYF
jgi:hypothetical protein